jgi:hypothetical protein
MAPGKGMARRTTMSKPPQYPVPTFGVGSILSARTAMYQRTVFSVRIIIYRDLN